MGYLSFQYDKGYNAFCIRDSIGNLTLRNERGLETNSPTPSW